MKKNVKTKKKKIIAQKKIQSTRQQFKNFYLRLYMNGLENIISSYLGMKKMIRYHLENERLKRKIKLMTLLMKMKT